MIKQYLQHTNEKCYSAFQLHSSHLNTATEKSQHSHREKPASEAFVIIVPILFLSVQENEIMHMDWISRMFMHLFGEEKRNPTEECDSTGAYLMLLEKEK